VFTLEAVDEQLFEFRCGLAPGTHLPDEGVGEGAGIGQTNFFEAEVGFAKYVDAYDITGGQLVGRVAFGLSVATDKQHAKQHAEEDSDEHSESLSLGWCAEAGR